jgi:hypothetical protein
MTESKRSLRSTAKKADGESEVLARIAAMPEPYRAIGERLHILIKASAPSLVPKTWYGMPAYARDGKCICFFRADKYMTIGFTLDANLFDEGVHLTPSAFALRELTAADEAQIAALVKKAVS